MDESGFGLSETTSSIGGFFGDVLEGLKPATIDSLGYRLRDSAGLYDGLEQPTQPAPIGPQPGTVAPGLLQPGNNTLLYVGLGLAALGGIALVAKG